MKTVQIPDELYEKIEENLKQYGFKTVEEYVVFVLENSLKEEEEEVTYSPEEEELIKKRLRDLGYLD